MGGGGVQICAGTPGAVSGFCRGSLLGPWPHLASGMSATLDLKSKEEKDAELDKRIEALRRKNEALIRRYQEIEEDRKKAELEGVAVTAPRKGRSVEKENMAVEVEWEERRRQNIEKMNEEMEKIAEYERNQREGVLEPNPVRNFLDDPRRRGGPLEEPERDRREGSRRHGRNWGGPDFERVRCGLEQERQGRRAGLAGAGDMTLSMTGRERSEYLRWKQEREKIDQERLQRHRKPTGQWRREWDAEKTDGMFKDGPAAALEPSHRYDDQAWARPPKPPTFREFLSQHKAEVSRRRRKGSRPQTKAAPRAYSDHDDRWETKEAASPAPEAPQPPPPEETPVQPLETPAPPAHRPPEDDGEEDEGEDEEWEDVSEEEEEIEEEEEGEEEEEAIEEEEEPAQDHQPQEAAPTGSPTGGDQPAPASLESGPCLPGTQKAEEEGSEAASEAGTEGQETAEITDFQRVRFCKVVAAAPPPGAAR
ncbi:coiled-coil domain-containing protein 9 isoform X7 [Panthera tigris]|uniref:coiled-coil domain-containing protein 9 isoform X7 n=1 Tax=Panthera tigris TaxID=9694 RepID=UPI001C6F841E|nr:coiled-coil domain-containing protein 9 isoform X7 [Panthera tigris]